jgi:predicted HTH transcriptional regulator
MCLNAIPEMISTSTGIMSPSSTEVTSPLNMPMLKVDQHRWLGEALVELGDGMISNAFGGAFPQNSIDALPLRDVLPDAIDRDKVVAHITEARARGRYLGPEDPDTYLALHKCVADLDGNLRATLTGLLCFGSNPQLFMPQAVVDIGHYRGIEAVSYDVVHLEKNIGGTIFDQLRRVEEYLWRNTHHGMTLPERGLRRVEVHEYPLAVIRELLVNLLAHRDYTLVGSAARVSLFRNRIEWISPGGLAAGVTVDNLLDIQTTRNPMLLTILHEAGLVEAYGQGLDTVVAVLRDEEMLPPGFRDVGAAFIVTVFGRQIDQLAPSGYVPLTDAQRVLVALVQERHEVTFGELCAALPDRSDRSVQEDIRALVEAGIVQRVGKTRAMRYRLRVNE